LHFIRYYCIETYYDVFWNAGVYGAGDENTQVCNADVGHW